MTFAEGVLRLVRPGVRIDRGEGPDNSEQPGGSAAAPASHGAAAAQEPFAVRVFAEDEIPESAAAASSHLEPGFSDIEAAVALVESGLATRVVLTGFPSWPGLLWQAYQLAEAAGVQILPTVVRPGGKVDIVIARATTADG